MRNKLLITILFLTGFLFIYRSAAPSDLPVLDSLEYELKKAQSDSARLYILFNLGWTARGVNPARAKEYCDTAVQFALKIPDKNMFARLLNVYGIIYKITGNYDSSIIYHDSAFRTFSLLGNKKGEAGSLFNLANMYGYQGDYVKSHQNLLLANKLFEEIGDTQGISVSLMNMGINYHLQKNYNKAYEFFLKASSLLYLINDYYSLGVVIMNIGTIHTEMKNYDSALTCFHRAISLYEKVQYDKGIANCYENIGAVHIILKNHVQGEDNILKALEFYEKAGMHEGIITANNYLGENFLKLENYHKALKHFIRAKEAGEFSGDIFNLVDIYQNLSKAYAGLEDYSHAFEYLKKYVTIKDSTLGIESQNQLTEMQTKYETEKKEKENELLRKDKQLKEGEINHQRLFILFIAAGLVLIFLLSVLIYRGYLLKKKANLELNRKNVTITRQKEEIENQKSVIEEKNRNITDSIYYAQRIQEAILPPKDLIKKIFPQSFIIYKPKDIICGDFYFLTSVNQYFLFAVADCTGHGVPGALMSMIGNDLLNDIINDKHVTTSAMVLEELDAKLMNVLNPQGKLSDVKDGMDIAFCAFNTATGELQFAGANRPLLIFKNGNLLECKPNKQPIGESGRKKEKFINQNISTEKGDQIFIFSDGFADQIGGANNKKLMTKGFKELLTNVSTLPMEEQEKTLDNYFESWKGGGEQMDDVTVMGIRV
ncbi:MAG: tetratricopeptide repeat protein [Bacteroidetes bacterium]|nr:tetratricopeptide repeat protein [Bacteroidota bacterium]